MTAQDISDPLLKSMLSDTMQTTIKLIVSGGFVDAENWFFTPDTLSRILSLYRDRDVLMVDTFKNLVLSVGKSAPGTELETIFAGGVGADNVLEVVLS